MNSPDFWNHTALILVNHTPFLVVYVIGLVVAFVKRRRCPRAAALVIAGLALMLAVTLLGCVVHVYLFNFLRSPMALEIMNVNGWMMRVGLSVGPALLIAAAFVGRAPSPAPDDGD